MHFDDGDVPSCRVVSCDPPARLVWEWPLREVASLVTVEVAPDADALPARAPCTRASPTRRPRLIPPGGTPTSGPRRTRRRPAVPGWDSTWSRVAGPRMWPGRASADRGGRVSGRLDDEDDLRPATRVRTTVAWRRPAAADPSWRRSSSSSSRTPRFLIVRPVDAVVASQARSALRSRRHRLARRVAPGQRTRRGPVAS